jgi:hypothetical protein
MTSGASPINSAAHERKRSALPSPQHVSTRKLLPSTHPRVFSPCKNVLRRTCPNGSSAPRFISTPIRRTRSGCCACAAAGKAIAELAIPWMNSRRRMRLPFGAEDGTIAREMTARAQAPRPENEKILLKIEWPQRVGSSLFFPSLAWHSLEHPAALSRTLVFRFRPSYDFAARTFTNVGTKGTPATV